MRITLCGMGATIAILPCLCFLAVGQDKAVQKTAPQASKKIQTMRNAANTNARALATAVQAHAITTGKYDNVLSDYAKELGGKLPINPCTGTRTGYTMTVINKGQSANVGAMAGKNCGKWVPMIFHLTL